MYERFVERRIEEALSDTPVVLIVGPRRAGKTMPVRKMGEAGRTYTRSTTTLFLRRRNPIRSASCGGWTGRSSMKSSARPICCWRSRRPSMRITDPDASC